MTTSDLTPFADVAAHLRRSIDAALPKLRAISSSRAVKAPSPDKWSPQQLIGHLIDSAANNHQRFVRAQQEGALMLPPYAQEHWVTSQRYHDRPWEDLIAFWYAYNQHLAHVILHIPEAFRQVPCTIGANPPVTLGFLAHDYVVHMQHHLAQIDALAAADDLR